MPILFLIAPSLNASGELCFVMVAFPEYLHLMFCIGITVVVPRRFLRCISSLYVGYSIFAAVSCQCFFLSVSYFGVPGRLYITKLRLYNFNPLKPHFYIVKLGFTGVNIFFILLKKHRLWVLVRTASPRRF